MTSFIKKQLRELENVASVKGVKFAKKSGKIVLAETHTDSKGHEKV